MERDKLAKFSPGFHYYYYYYSNLNVLHVSIELAKSMNWKSLIFPPSTGFNFESLKVNISFTDRNFWLSKSYTVCLCQLFQLFSPNKLHCSTHWTSIYKLLEIKVLLLSKLPAKLPEGTEQAAAALQCPSSSLFLFTIKGLKTNMRKLPINTIDLKNTRDVLNSIGPSIRGN